MAAVDFDIFEPTLVALENLFELIPKGGIVAFDQFSYENFPGETLAFKEKLGLDYSLKKFSYHPFISYFVKWKQLLMILQYIAEIIKLLEEEGSN